MKHRLSVPALLQRLLPSLLLVSGLVQAGARDDLDAFTRGLKGLQGDFSQQVFDAQGRKKETSSGHVALSAPKLFRWEYVEPYPQLIVADGAKVWIYDPDLKQVTTRSQGAEEQNSPLAALTDPKKLDQTFTVSEAGQAEGLAWLELAPRRKDGAGFSRARLGFSGQALARMQIVDGLGQRTEIAFTGWQRNPRFAAGTFRFTPPKGVDVVGGE